MKNLGLLLHISSLPSDFGIGDFGPSAYQFADLLAEKGLKYWQILPLNQTGYGNSPYNPMSAFALNPYLISPELLYEDGHIDLPDLEAAQIPTGDQVPFETVYRLKDQLLATAAENYISDNDVEGFIEKEARYLKPYLAYTTLCKLYGEDDWNLFRQEHRSYSPQLYDQLFKDYGRQMLHSACAQIFAREQLARLKDYLSSLGISLIGDMPLYLSHQSSEVWANRHIFDLDPQGHRLRVAGVPPDAFSEKGQLWGNPLYCWEAMREDGFRLFFDRIDHALQYLDKLRLDHFIGYVNYWAVDCPQDPETGLPQMPEDALDGSWEKALPQDFFTQLKDRFPLDKFIAEDLGILNDEVCGFRDRFGLPGMIVLQFCFEDGVPEPRDFPPERFLYIGTHDNPTIHEWHENLEPDSPSRTNLLNYIRENAELFAGLGLETIEDIQTWIHAIFCQIAQNSGCKNLIFTVQDILGLGSDARMNIPGTALGNWQWKLEDLAQLQQIDLHCWE